MLEVARERVAGLGYGVGWELVKALPPRVARRTFRSGADAATVRNGPAVRQLRRNLRRVVGPGVSELRMDRLIGDALRSYARYWLETFTLADLDHTAVAASFEANMSGKQHIDAGLAAGNGVILALPHSGNWDASGIWLVAHSGPFTTVAERLRPASVFDRFVAYRESIGMEVIALDGDERSPVAVLRERLRHNRVVCLLADRDLSGRGIPVDFFGATARMPGGPALLAATTGATLHTVNSHFVGSGWGHDVSAPIATPGTRLRGQVTSGTQAMADRFAEGIAAHPRDWHMLQPLWLADRQPAGRSGAGAG